MRASLGFLGSIIPIEGTSESPRLIETVTPVIEKAIEHAKVKLVYLRKKS